LQQICAADCCLHVELGAIVDLLLASHLGSGIIASSLSRDIPSIRMQRICQKSTRALGSSPTCGICDTECTVRVVLSASLFVYPNTRKIMTGRHRLDSRDCERTSHGLLKICAQRQNAHGCCQWMRQKEDNARSAYRILTTPRSEVNQSLLAIFIVLYVLHTVLVV
jgi:hypothetical protein